MCVHRTFKIRRKGTKKDDFLMFFHTTSTSTVLDWIIPSLFKLFFSTSSLQIRELKVLKMGRKSKNGGGGEEGEENSKNDENGVHNPIEGEGASKEVEDDLDRIERCVTPSASPSSRSHLKLQLLKEYDNLSRSSSGSSFPRPSNFHSKVRIKIG